MIMFKGGLAFGMQIDNGPGGGGSQVGGRKAASGNETDEWRRGC